MAEKFQYFPRYVRSRPILYSVPETRLSETGERLGEFILCVRRRPARPSLRPSRTRVQQGVQFTVHQAPFCNISPFTSTHSIISRLSKDLVDITWRNYDTDHRLCLVLDPCLWWFVWFSLTRFAVTSPSKLAPFDVSSHSLALPRPCIPLECTVFVSLAMAINSDRSPHI